MWNKELYVREQQDAYEFFTSLVDQMDEYLKVKSSGISFVVYMHLLGTFSLSPLFFRKESREPFGLFYNLHSFQRFKIPIAFLVFHSAIYPTDA